MRQCKLYALPLLFIRKGDKSSCVGEAALLESLQKLSLTAPHLYIISNLGECGIFWADSASIFSPDYHLLHDRKDGGCWLLVFKH